MNSAGTTMRREVLLVEDDVETARALRLILTMHGCDVTAVRTLEQGLDLLAQNPTIIVADLMLPDGDGIEILARVRDAKSPTKVVITTSVGDPARLALVNRLKPDALLRKPFEPAALLRAMGVA
jgi:DNA-binding response OmpR family regulator